MLRFLLLADTIAPGVVFDFQPLLNALVPLVAALVLEILRRVWKERATERERLIGACAQLAYLVTTEAAKLTPNEVDDKVAYALGVFHRALEAKRAAPPTAAETEQARLTWSAMHGAEQLGKEGLPVPR